MCGTKRGLRSQRALALALANWQQTEQVSFYLEGHGREECVSGVDITRTVGWFTSLFPVALSLPEIKDINNLTDLDYKACIQSIKEQLRDIPDKGLSYGALKYLASRSSKEQVDAMVAEAVEEARRIDEASMAEHNLKATIISMVLGFICLALLTI